MTGMGRSDRLLVLPWALLIVATLGSWMLALPAAAQDAAGGEVTFARDVAPILQRSCQNCHRPNGGLAPMALTTYEEVRPWARAIKLRTELREMPPWFIEKNVGIQHFKDDTSLSDEEIATIGAWVDSGAPLGDPAYLPPPLEFSDVNAWSLGEPDLIVDSRLLTVEAEAGDFYSPYIGATETGLTEDRWVEAFEVKEYRPGEVRRTAGRGGNGNDFFVLHHQGIDSLPPIEAGGGGEESGAGEPEAAAEEPQPRRGSLQYVYNVGHNAQYVPRDVGVALEAGGKIYFTGTHLHSIGKEVQFKIRIGFKLHPAGYQPKYPQGMQGLRPAGGVFGDELDIPGNTSNVRYDQFRVVDRPARMVTFEPHLHASGVRMCVAAMYPDGVKETLNCAGYNHSWVRSYVYEDDYAPLLPAGTILHTTAWFDNSATNPLVSDPRNWRGLGHRSVDDMFILLSRYTFFSEEEFADVVAEREMRLKAAGATAQNDD